MTWRKKSAAEGERRREEVRSSESVLARRRHLLVVSDEGYGEVDRRAARRVEVGVVVGEVEHESHLGEEGVKGDREGWQ